MLPSSHFLLIDDPPVDHAGRRRDESAQGLANAFSEFIAASSRLESSYRDLQEEVSGLKQELSRGRAALQQSRAENGRMRLALQQIVDSMPCGVLVVGAEGRIAMLNPEARRLLGAEGLVQAGPFETLRQLSEVSGIDLGCCTAVEECGEMVREFRLRQAEDIRWIEVRNRQMIDAAKDDEGQTILILRDVTTHKRAEEDREAGRNAMARAELARVLAHEIRNPLASLELFSELVEKDETGRGQWTTHLRAGLRSLSATVNNVLSYERGEFTLEPIELCSVIGNALDFVKPMMKQASVSLKAPAPGEPAWVMGNRVALQQLILNLTSNALRHTPPGGRIKVTIERRRSAQRQQARETVIEFADSGCGIPPAQLQTIFEPGFSGTGETSGLGLAVCRRIMQRHGGQISATNGAAGGARFTLSFPEIEAESERP